jgi:hypothetical protein
MGRWRSDPNGLYVLAALLIGYFGVNAFSGNHGLNRGPCCGHAADELAKENI